MIKNAIVVMFDSQQWNYPGCRGNDWIKTPHFDRLAREGVLFENASMEGLPTAPEVDELYCRKKSRYQLHSVITGHPEQARKLFLQDIPIAFQAF